MNGVARRAVLLTWCSAPVRAVGQGSENAVKHGNCLLSKGWFGIGNCWRLRVDNLEDDGSYYCDKDPNEVCCDDVQQYNLVKEHGYGPELYCYFRLRIPEEESPGTEEPFEGPCDIYYNLRTKNEDHETGRPVCAHSFPPRGNTRKCTIPNTGKKRPSYLMCCPTPFIQYNVYKNSKIKLHRNGYNDEPKTCTYSNDLPQTQQMPQMQSPGGMQGMPHPARIPVSGSSNQGFRLANAASYNSAIDLGSYVGAADPVAEADFDAGLNADAAHDGDHDDGGGDGAHALHQQEKQSPPGALVV